ncbi:DUF397 domain-containing protein [Streptomyces barkulensis]|uniref:DUF397 domain-containing protein n=1 Tax=Streptomyces barkulensis TaxID=1257026 RepID=UPI000C6D8260|nr:DUF397 domain-containing protein [Streptomyces barkulensis]
MSTDHGPSTTAWRKSSHSNGDGGACVEVADGFHGVIPVRDSKAPDGPTPVFPDTGWSAFVTAVKGGMI